MYGRIRKYPSHICLTMNLKNLTPVENIIVNFVRGKPQVMMSEIIMFRGKDSAHTTRIVNRLIWRKVLKRGKLIGRERIIKVSKQL